MSKVKLLTTPLLLDLNERAIKAKRNRALADDVPLDPAGIHLVMFSLVHQDREVRAMLMLKLVDIDAPVSAFLDMSFEDFAALPEVDPADIEARAVEAEADERERTKKRHPVTMNRLGQVAVSYSQGGIEGVRDQLGVSKSQAYRLIELARSKGVMA